MARKLNAEDVLDFLALFEIFDMNRITDKVRKEKGKTPEQIGKSAFFYMLSELSTKESKDKFFNFISKPLEMKPEDVRVMPAIDLFKQLYEVATVDEWVAFFSSVTALKQ